MMKKFNLLTGTRVLEEVDSAVNGKVRVIQSLGWGNYVQAGELTQSGGVLHGVWKYSLRKVKTQISNVKTCLILGLGGGSCARLVRRDWPSAEIIGVEIDPVMVDLGMKYLGLGKVGVDIKTMDATEYCKDAISKQEKHDLVLVDMYVGSDIPVQFETDEWVETTKKLLNDGAVAVYNRLYFDEKRGMAERFRKRLEKAFSSVDPVYPEANVMYVCRV